MILRWKFCEANPEGASKLYVSQWEIVNRKRNNDWIYLLTRNLRMNMGQDEAECNPYLQISKGTTMNGILVHTQERWRGYESPRKREKNSNF